MNYKLVFAPSFENDIDKTFEYISKSLDAPKAAKKLMADINRSISFAAENPYMYPLCFGRLSLLGYRKIVIKNYIAVYFIDENEKTVNFLNLFYGRQNYADFFKC